MIPNGNKILTCAAALDQAGWIHCAESSVCFGSAAMLPQGRESFSPSPGWRLQQPQWVYSLWISQHCSWEMQSLDVTISRNTQEEMDKCLTSALSSVESWKSIFLKTYFNWEGCFALPGDYFAHLLLPFINFGINCHIEIAQCANETLFILEEQGRHYDLYCSQAVT